MLGDGGVGPTLVRSYVLPWGPPWTRLPASAKHLECAAALRRRVSERATSASRTVALRAVGMIRRGSFVCNTKSIGVLVVDVLSSIDGRARRA